MDLPGEQRPAGILCIWGRRIYSGLIKEPTVAEKFPICENNSTATFCCLTAPVCIWVSISLAYNTSCHRRQFWSIRSQIPACSRTGLLSDWDVSRLCWFSCLLTLKLDHTHKWQCVKSCGSGVDASLKCALRVTIGHKESKAHLTEDDNKACFMFLVQQMLNLPCPKHAGMWIEFCCHIFPLFPLFWLLIMSFYARDPIKDLTSKYAVFMVSN